MPIFLFLFILLHMRAPWGKPGSLALGGVELEKWILQGGNRWWVRFGVDTAP